MLHSIKHILSIALCALSISHAGVSQVVLDLAKYSCILRFVQGTSWQEDLLHIPAMELGLKLDIGPKKSPVYFPEIDTETYEVRGSLKWKMSDTLWEKGIFATRFKLLGDNRILVMNPRGLTLSNRAKNSIDISNGTDFIRFTCKDGLPRFGEDEIFSGPLLRVLYDNNLIKNIILTSNGHPKLLIDATQLKPEDFRHVICFGIDSLTNSAPEAFESFCKDQMGKNYVIERPAPKDPLLRDFECVEEPVGLVDEEEEWVLVPRAIVGQK